MGTEDNGGGFRKSVQIHRRVQHRNIADRGVEQDISGESGRGIRPAGNHVRQLPEPQSEHDGRTASGVRTENTQKNEQEVQKYQEETFGEKRHSDEKNASRCSNPIRRRFFKAISDYAAAAGYDIVIDIAANPAVLYYNPACDMTQKIIESVKK
ncbi:MAG: OmpH family outer membrane protein [Alistipes putredinis]|nr:MAG: OmpH family outer membrane protein [Alistipes putredinis]